ncbi:MAG: glycosyltransferase family 4 protein [Bacteroidetes bacterium]|nr:glycosyltransferase family 4 protein [Bacteroidota bacterium]
MRVLFLQHGLGYGGATKSMFIMQQALYPRAEIYTIIKRNKRINKVLSKEFIYSKEIKEIDIPMIYSYSEGTISLNQFEKNKGYYPHEIIDFIKENKIDILHINSSVFSHILKAIKEKTKCKIVVHVREMLPYGMENKIDAYIIENTLKYADKIIAISPNELKVFKSVEKTYVLPNPHDFSVTDAFINEDEEHKVIRIGMCANFIPIKGHLVFIKAIKLINAKTENKAVEFRIIGYPKKENSLRGLIKWFISKSYKRQVDTLINKFSITNLKLVPFTFEPLKEINKLDIYIRPDLSGNPWGRDIIEAMALKKPIIATGTSDFYIVENSNGFLIEPGNAEQLAGRILKLIADKELRERMGNNGYKLAVEKCNMIDYSLQLMKIYL